MLFCELNVLAPNIFFYSFFRRTDFEGGTCFLKSGPAGKIEAVTTGNPGTVCGIPINKI
jgi:hypothetical protein